MSGIFTLSCVVRLRVEIYFSTLLRLYATIDVLTYPIGRIDVKHIITSFATDCDIYLQALQAGVESAVNERRAIGV